MSSNSRRVRSTDAPCTKTWNWSGRTSISPACTASAAGPSPWRRRRVTASIRAISSSGWQGLVTQSSAPMRSPRTRWETVDGPVQTMIGSAGSSRVRRSRYSHACGPASARSSTSAPRRIATSPSGGTAPDSTRCSHPSRSNRFVRTWTKPVSPSLIATRNEPPVAACVVVSFMSRPSVGAGSDGSVPMVTGSSQLGVRKVRANRELPEHPGDEKRGLLADVDRVVADALEGARDERHEHRPLARVLVVAGRDREPEDLTVEAVELAGPGEEGFGELDLAPGERAPALHDLSARPPPHPQHAPQDLAPHRRLVARQGDELGHRDALVAHPLDVAHEMQQRGEQAQIAGNRALQRQQRQDLLLHRGAAIVDARVIGQDHGDELDVLVLERLNDAIEQREDEVERSQRELLDVGE